MRWSLALLALPAVVACAAPVEEEERGATESRIVGGQVAANTFPGIVRMQSSDGTACGATLVGKQWALTAAHCVEGVAARGGSITLTAGKTRLSAPGGEVLRVAQVIMHEGYSGNAPIIDNDVALLKLAAPTSQPFARIVTPAEWQTIGVIGTPVTIAGWGRTVAGGQQSDELRHVTLPFISRQQCGMNPNTICVADPNQQKGQCQGDSGGPWYALANGEPVYVGTVSWTQGRCNVVQGAMRVVNYLTWLSAKTNGEVPFQPPPPPPPAEDAGTGDAPAEEPGKVPAPETEGPTAAPTEAPAAAPTEDAEETTAADAPDAPTKRTPTASSCNAGPTSSLPNGFGLGGAIAALGFLVARRRRR